MRGAKLSARFTYCSTNTMPKSPAIAQQLEDLEQLLHDHRRQALHRFIQQQKPRIAHERPSDAEHLLLAAGNFVAAVAADAPPDSGTVHRRRPDSIVPAARRSADFPRLSARGKCRGFAAHSRCRRARDNSWRETRSRDPGRRSCPTCNRVWPAMVFIKVDLPTPLRPSTASTPPCIDRERDVLDDHRLAEPGCDPVKPQQDGHACGLRDRLRAPAASAAISCGAPSTRIEPCTRTEICWANRKTRSMS